MNFKKAFISETEIERRRKISAAFKGKPLLMETRRKMSEAAKGRIISVEQREKISKSLTGRPPSEETRRKISAANTGKIRTKETCQKISEGRKGIVFTDEHKQKLSDVRVGRFGGDKHPAWKGGVSFEPYCIKFNDEFKERVREFFNHHCVECGKPQTKERLLVHHVNFDKQTCCNDNIPLFVPLCRSCHAKTNFRRDYWQDRFTRLINEQNGGMCYYSKGGNDAN